MSEIGGFRAYRGCLKDSDDDALGFADIKDLLKVCNVPKKIVGAARTRFDQLNNEKRTVLKRACVVHAFSLKMLSHLLGVKTDDPDQHSLDAEVRQCQPQRRPFFAHSSRILPRAPRPMPHAPCHRTRRVTCSASVPILVRIGCLQSDVDRVLAIRCYALRFPSEGTPTLTSI